MSAHTPGPWRWELSMQSKNLHLVGGRPQFDLTIIQPTRWGMGSATLCIRDTAHDGMNIMHKLHERTDWIAPFPGRSHHASWCSDVTHPDMRLISAAPELLEALRRIMQHAHWMESCSDDDEGIRRDIERANAAIAKAEGRS